MADKRVTWHFFNKYYLNRRFITIIIYYLLLYNILIKFYELGQVFLQNNARIYITKLSKKFFKSYSVWVINYLLYSPNFNLIKYLWAALKAKFIKFYPNLYNILDNREIKYKIIKKAIKTIFNIMLGEAQQELLKQLIKSIPARLQTVKDINNQ